MNYKHYNLIGGKSRSSSSKAKAKAKRKKYRPSQFHLDHQVLVQVELNVNL